jgi:hypothetical protein
MKTSSRAAPHPQPAAGANATPEAAALAKNKLVSRFAPMMVRMALSPDDSRALLDVLCVLHTDPAFRNLVQLLCPAWFAGVLCHTKEATALKTALRTAGDGAADGDDDSAAYDDGNARSVALQAELDAAAENDNEDTDEAAAAPPLFPPPGADVQAAAPATAGAAAAAPAPVTSWPPSGPA